MVTFCQCAVASDAAGAALAAAIIPAAAVITGGGGGTTETLKQTIDGIAMTAAGGNGAEANFDVDAINAALSHSPGGASGESNEETFLVDHPSDVTDVAKVDGLIYSDPFNFGGEGAIGSAAGVGDSPQLAEAVAVDQLLFDFVFNAGGVCETAFDAAPLLPDRRWSADWQDRRPREFAGDLTRTRRAQRRGRG